MEHRILADEDVYRLPDMKTVIDIIVTDSIAQIEDLGERYFLHPHIPLSRYVSLSDIVCGNHLGRTNARQQILFCSIGLAGTEVAVANHAFDLMGKLDPPSS